VLDDGSPCARRRTVWTRWCPPQPPCEHLRPPCSAARGSPPLRSARFARSRRVIPRVPRSAAAPGPRRTAGSLSFSPACRRLGTDVRGAAGTSARVRAQLLLPGLRRAAGSLSLTCWPALPTREGAHQAPPPPSLRVEREKWRSRRRDEERS